MVRAATKLGYARASLLCRSVTHQIRALEDAGCDEVFTENQPTIADAFSADLAEHDTFLRPCSDRPVLQTVLTKLQPGDMLVIWRLDRLGRSLPDLSRILQTLSQRGIDFVSLSDGIDTRITGGRLVFDIVVSLTRFEHDETSEYSECNVISENWTDVLPDFGPPGWRIFRA